MGGQPQYHSQPCPVTQPPPVLVSTTSCTTPRQAQTYHHIKPQNLATKRRSKYTAMKMPSVPTPSKAGIVDTPTGERHIPSSTRADGSKRKEIKIRPGYKPPEDVEVYKNRTTEGFRTRGTGLPPGAEGLRDGEEPKEVLSASANAVKNQKRREARKKTAERKPAEPNPSQGKSAGGKGIEDSWRKPEPPKSTEPVKEEVDPEIEWEKKGRNLKKKLKQARELKEKKEDGAALLPEQFAKVIKITELVRELEALGFGDEGEVKGKPEEAKVAE